MGENKITRNLTLDFLKWIAAYMVVFIHVPFYDKFGELIKALAHFAVPIFFMTSGYFCYKNDQAVIKRKILKIVYILIWSSLLYNFTNVGFAYFNGGISSVINYLSVYTQPNRWLDLLLFNRAFSATRLWFLFALIYVYAFQLLLNKIKASYKMIAIISIALIMVSLIIGEVLSIFKITVPDHFIRNFLLTGYPFFAFGLLIRKHQEKPMNINAPLTVTAAVIGALWSMVTVFYAKEITISFGGVILAVSLFVLALKYPVIPASTLGGLLHKKKPQLPVINVITKKKNGNTKRTNNDTT